MIWLARLRPGAVITVTTVFSALRSVEGGVINRAGAGAVRDEFGNAVDAPRQTEIPIRIVPGPGEATATPRPRERKPAEQPTPTAEATALATPSPGAAISDTLAITATSVATPTLGPASLPRTGAPGQPRAWLWLALALIAAGALALRYRLRQPE
jgi:hypothetical protein